MPASQAYSSAKFQVELQGKTIGFVRSVEGGEPFATVIEEPVSANGIVQKHIGSVAYKPIRLTFANGMSKELFDWISEFLDGQRSPRNGAVVFVDLQGNEVERLEFRDALITEFTIPAFDGGRQDVAEFSLTLQPESTLLDTSGKGNTNKSIVAKGAKRTTSRDFSLKISGIETATARVTSIDAMTFVQADARSGGEATPLQVPNVRFTLPQVDASPFRDWFDDFAIQGNAGPNGERSGSLTMLDAARATTFFTIAFTNLGVLSVGRARAESGSEVIARATVDCYCERMSLTVGSEALGTSPSKGSTSGGSSGGTTTGSTGSNGSNGATGIGIDTSALAGVLLGLASGRLRNDEAIRATLRLASLPDATSTADTTETVAKVVARRLSGTVPLVDAMPKTPGRDEGIKLGERWATERASLDELRQIAALEPRSWTSIKLGEGHSLIAALRDASIVPAFEDGPIELPRDAFDEGIVAGAAGVLKQATPHLEKTPG